MDALEGAVAAERRLITIMFCDLVGSTVLSQRLDPEDYAEVVLTYQRLSRSVVERNGGIVANYSGDGIVAQFGYPNAHENDAERAVVSGLEICREVVELDATLGTELGERIQCRIGAHASVSIVGRMRTESDDMSIFGDTANIASRVEGMAGPGEVCVTGAVVDLLGGEYEIVNERTVELKGVMEPTSIAHVVGPVGASGVGTGRLHIDHVDHVGRLDEIDQLRQEWNAVIGGTSSFVVVSAAAGLGKSTLVASFLDSLATTRVVIGRGRVLTESESFGVLAQLATSVDSHALDHEVDEQVRRAAQRVRDSLDATRHAAMSAEARWVTTVDAGIALLRAVSRSPVVVVIEDLHWVDASSREVIERFAADAGSHRAMVLATMRPSSTVEGAVCIGLGQMDDDDLRALVVAHAHADTPGHVIDDIVRRADGVPLFAVELARGASGDGGATVPESLQASLLARLAEHPLLTRLAQVASVAGDVVDADLLSDVLDIEPESVLRDIAALTGSHVFEWISDGACQFAHSLMREAVYGSLLRSDRRTLHRTFADVLSAGGARTDGRLSTVGHHLALGGRRIEAAECYATASRRTARRGAFRDAIDLADRGLDALGAAPEPSSTLLSLRLTKGNALNAAVGYAAPGLFELWLGIEQTAEQVGDLLEQSSGMNGQSVTALFDGNYLLALERADRILALGETHDDRVARLRGQCSRALPQIYLGRVGDASISAERAIDLYRDGDHELVTYGFGTDQLAIALSAAASASFFAGDARAASFTQRSIDHSRALDSPISLAMSLNQAAMLAMFADDPDAAMTFVDQTWEVCDRYDLPFFRMTSSLSRAAALARLGVDGARDLAYEALFGGVADGESDTGSNMALTLGYLLVALCEEHSGGTDAAFGLAAAGLDIVRERGELVLEVELLTLQQRCRPTLEVEHLLDEALVRAAERGAHGSIERSGRR